MNLGLILAVGLAACLIFLIVFMEISDRRVEREEQAFFERAIRVYGTVTDFGLRDVQYARSQRFSAIYEVNGKQYTVDSGLLAKGEHVYAVGEKVVVFVDPMDHSKAKLVINQLRRSFGNPNGKPGEEQWYK